MISTTLQKIKNKKQILNKKVKMMINFLIINSAIIYQSKQIQTHPRNLLPLKDNIQILAAKKIRISTKT